MLTRIFRFMVIVISVALMPAAAWGAEVNSITASPTNKRIEVAAGATSAGTIKVMNSGQTDFDFTLYADPYSVKGEDYDQSFILQPEMVDVSKWFVLRQTRYQLQAGKELAVPYELRVPAGVRPGGYYAVLFAETSATGEGNIKSKKRVGIIFYITVTGSLVHKASVASFAVPSIQMRPPLETVLRMKNEGNVHYDAEVRLNVKDIFGNTKSVLSVDKVILPQTIRKLPLSWDKAPEFGLFRVDGTVKYDGKTEQLPAKYTLMFSSTAFLVAFLALVALLGYLYFSRGRRGNVSRRR